MPSVSVIICAHTEQRYQDILAAVASLHQQTVQPTEIIVVIDHNPTLLERLKSEWGNAVLLLANEQERGLSGARNTGIARASGDILAFIDDDAAAAPDWLEKLLAVYHDPRIAGAGGTIQPNWLAGAPRWFPEEFQWVVGCTYRGMPTQVAPVRNLIGANMSFRREVFQIAGEFSNGMGRVGSLPVGCEETEICIRYRLRMPDHEFLFVPAAQVKHNVPAARGTWQYFRSRCYHEGRSKAQVVQMVGAGKGLASERTYTMRVLPTGVLRGIKDTLTKFDLGGLGRAIAIIAGLLITTIGYLYGKYTTRNTQTQQYAAQSNT